jgi:hypothetical protein
MSPADWSAIISINTVGTCLTLVLYIFSMRDNLIQRIFVSLQSVFIVGSVLLGGNLLNSENEDS